MGHASSTSVLLPFVPRKVEQVLPYAALVESSEAGRLWQGHSVMVDALHGFVSAASAGFRVPTGLGVSLVPFRHPFDAAHQVRSLAMATGQPVTAGFGPASVDMQRALRGTPYKSPLTACREYLNIVRGLLAGQPVEFEGQYFTCFAEMSAAVTPPIELGLGVLRPGMARLAGEVADVAITWLAPPAYLRDVIVPAVTQSALAAGRPLPRIVAMLPVALTRPYYEPTELLIAGNSIHLLSPHYSDMLRLAGVDHAGADLTLTAKRAVEAGVLAYGELEDVIEQVQAYREAGVDEVVLNLTGVHKVHGGAEALRDAKKLVSAIA